ncbi:SDR family NAD(P)-dependent oxidoreductase, partial [Mycobacterium tuberculosis]|nr:SDR family NAD(P)-dependent oxidoreductase [Mycobacterium tuberculosis]
MALVTGAGSGIGRASAERLAADGATVVALSRTADEVEAVADAIRGRGGLAAALTADVADAEQMRAAVGRIAAEQGQLD